MTAVAPVAPRVLTAVLLAVALAIAVGCGEPAEQRKAEDAIDRAARVATIAYTGKVETQVEGATGATGATAATLTPASAVTRILFTGAADVRGAEGPRSQLDMIVQGVNVRAVAPGDGFTYVVAPSGTFGAPVEASREGGAENLGSVLRTLKPVLSDYRPANEDRTKDGEPLSVVSARADADEFCDGVVPAFSEYMDTASANVSSVKNLTGDAPLGAVCGRLLDGDPTFWFGVDSDGMLRMIAMRGRLSLLGAQSLKLTLRFDVTAYGEPVSIAKPDGATMLGSQAELRRRSALPSGG